MVVSFASLLLATFAMLAATIEASTGVPPESAQAGVAAQQVHIIDAGCSPASAGGNPGPPDASSSSNENALPASSSYQPMASLSLHDQHPHVSLDDYKVAASADPAATKFKDYVDRALAGSPDYGYSPSDAVVQFARTGEERYIRSAIDDVDAYVAQAETDISQGQPPHVASDDYLEVGYDIADLALAYDWGYAQLTDDQRRRWKEFGDQAISNVWNPSRAEWGGSPAHWSGWSINNPGNNYFYSFVRGTELWALATCEVSWMEFLQTYKFPLETNYVEALPGGGSREGTGYGTAQRRLWENARMWAHSTGEHLPAVENHARQSIDYWIHATVPTLDIFAPFGDQSRESFTRLYDYQENLVREAAMAAPGSAETDRALWWITHNSVPDTMQNSFNLRDALLRPSGTPASPSPLTYKSDGVGHFFARSSWDAHATWLATTAGPNDESHAHEDQGSFYLYRDGWLAVTSNIWSHSGLQGNSAYSDKLASGVHNIVRFDKDTSTVDQRPDTVSSMLTSTADSAVTVREDLSAAYPAAEVRSWTRRLVFSDRHLGVSDRCSVAAGVTPVWQLQVPTRPLLHVPGEMFAGALRLRFNPYYSVRFVSMASLDPDFSQGWRIELRNKAGCAFDVALDVTSTRYPNACGAYPSGTPCPETFITKRPRKTTRRRIVRFAFSSPTFGARFQCSFDRRPFKTCASPLRKKLGRGRHSFRVRAVVSGGRRDLTPATYRFRIVS